MADGGDSVLQQLRGPRRMLAIKITTIRLQNAYLNSVYELGS